MPTITINGVKHTPGSNTLKKMKRKAAAEAATKKTTPKTKKATAPKEKAPVPMPRKKRPVPGLRVPKGPTMVGGKRGGSAAYTKGGNGGDKKSTVLGVGPKAKLSTEKKKSWKNKGNQMVRVMRYE